MKTYNIADIYVTLPGDAEWKKIGVRKDGERVYLYLLDDEEAVKLNGPIDVLNLLTTVHRTCCLGNSVSAIDWRLRSGCVAAYVAIDGEGPSRQMTISNTYVCYGQPAPLADYRRDVFHEFRPVLRSDRGPPEQEQTYFLQDTPDGKTCFFNHASPTAAEDNDVVYVDSRKLRRLMQQHAPEQLLRKNERRPRKQAGLTASLSDAPQHLLRLACRQTSVGLTFGITTGSADLLEFLLDSGADRFPVAVRKDEAALLRKLCGADTRKPSAGTAPGP